MSTVLHERTAVPDPALHSAGVGWSHTIRSLRTEIQSLLNEITRIREYHDEAERQFQMLRHQPFQSAVETQSAPERRVRP